MEKKIYNLIILDKSGSMETIRNQAIAGLNETVNTIKKAQRDYPDQSHFVSILVFCGCSQDYLVKNMPAESVGKIKAKDYEPCCMTPLYDAMGKGINEMNEVVRGKSNIAVSVTVITDGYENASRIFSGRKIASLVEECKSRGWLFSYIGANQDAESVGDTLSIDNVMSFDATEKGTKEMFLAELKSRGNWFWKLEKRPNLTEEILRSMNENYFDEGAE